MRPRCSSQVGEDRIRAERVRQVSKERGARAERSFRTTTSQPMMAHRHAERQPHVRRQYPESIACQFQQAPSSQVGWSHLLGRQDA